MKAIRVENNAIVSRYGGNISDAPGLIFIDQITSDLIESLDAEAKADSRSVNVLWNNGVPTLPVDQRPVLAVTVNGGIDPITVMVGDSFTIEIAMAVPFDGPLIIPVFERRFLFTFVGGIATKAITVTESRLYEISSDSSFRVTSPISIDAVE